MLKLFKFILVFIINIERSFSKSSLFFFHNSFYEKLFQEHLQNFLQQLKSFCNSFHENFPQQPVHSIGAKLFKKQQIP